MTYVATLHRARREQLCKEIDRESFYHKCLNFTPALLLSEFRIPVLELWFEEMQTFQALKAEEEKRFRVLLEKTFHRCNHGDKPACLFWDIISLELQRSSASIASFELEQVIVGAVGESIINCYIRYNMGKDSTCRDNLLSVFMGMSPKLRRWCLQHLSSIYVEALAKLLGSEVVNVLSKTRVEIKLVLGVEEVLPFGKEWREKAKEAFREALKMW